MKSKKCYSIVEWIDLFAPGSSRRQGQCRRSPGEIRYIDWPPNQGRLHSPPHRLSFRSNEHGSIPPGTRCFCQCHNKGIITRSTTHCNKVLWCITLRSDRRLSVTVIKWWLLCMFSWDTPLCIKPLNKDMYKSSTYCWKTKPHLMPSLM